MRKIGIGDLLLVVLVSLVVVLGFTVRARAELAVSEAGLNPDGFASEINPDDVGRLWISDFSAGEIWGVNPSNGAYEVYPVTGAPTDARQAGDWLWWADGLINILGRVSTSDGAFTQWEVPDAYGFLGTNLDDQGRLYATDSSNPYLYRLEPGSAELCTIILPGYGASNYIVRDAGYLWLGDGFDGILLRFQISDNSLTWWSLPEGSSPFGMAVDALGNLWYADQGTNVLAQLNPTTNQLTRYVLPSGNYPQMIAIQSGWIWYTEQSLASFGRMDPLTANHTIVTLTPQSDTLTPDCIEISPSSTGSITITSGDLSWGDTTYPTIVGQAGWKIYQMPVESFPWGIALTDSGYVVDPGRQVLSRFTPSYAPSMIVIKHVINDNGGTAVASDFTMTVDDPDTNPPSFPGAEAPGTEVIVDPGPYIVSETGPSGYTASYSADCTGTLATGQTKTCTITNDDIAPKLVVIKHVINDSGGTAVAGDFSMTVDDPGTNPSSFPGAESPGTEVIVDPGSYTVSETGPSGYAASYSTDCTGILAIGQIKTCTVTNNDIAPRLIVIKHVINDSGGTAVAGDFTMTVDDPGTNPSSFPGAELPGTEVIVDPGDYTVSETGPSGYTATYSTDCTGTLAIGQTKTCTVTNNDIASGQFKIYLPIIIKLKQ